MTNLQLPIRPPKPPIAILGVPIDMVTASEALELLARMAMSGRPHYFVTANVDFLVQSAMDDVLHRIFLDADLILCDGAPIVWASRMLGNPLPERIAGADLVPQLLHLSEQRGFRVFFLGATPDSAEAAIVNVRREHPGLVIAGHYSPPIGELQDLDRQEILERVRAAGPDFLFVAFGCPKQEKWIAKHYMVLGVPVSGGVGATIDFLSRRRSRAPKWMQRAGLEWAFRLVGEPRRLFRRYWNDFWIFGSQFIIQYWHLQFTTARNSAGHAVLVDGADNWICIKAPLRLDAKLLEGDPLLTEQPEAVGRHCLLDLSGTKFIDSTGVGFLVHLHKAARSRGHQLVLISPDAVVRRALGLSRLEGHFTIVSNLRSALALLECGAAQPRSGG